MGDEGAARVNYRAIEIETESKSSSQTLRKRQDAAVILLTRAHCYEMFKQATGTMILLVYVGSIVI